MNLARFIIEGSVGGVSPADDRGFDAVHEEEISFRLEDGASNRVRSFHIQVYSPSNATSPRCSKDAPLLSLVGKTTGQFVEAPTPAGDITTEMPASGNHAWLVVGTVNGGRDAEGNLNEDYRFARIIAIRSEAGARKLVVGESTEYSVESWVDAFNELVDAGPIPAGSVTEETLSDDLATELFGATPAPTLLYVNGTTGNDDNAGTIGAPLATLTAALRRVGTKVRASCEIRIAAAGTYDATALSTPRNYGPYFVDVIAARSTEVVVDTGVVTSSTYQQITASAESWAVDVHAGLKFRVTSGPQLDEVRTVIANTATAALLVDGFPANLAPGVTFELTRPGVILEFPAYGVIQGDSRGYLSLRNVELSWPDNSGLYFFGSTYLVGVTARPGATRSSKFIYGYYGAPYCDVAAGFGWRANGSVPVGDIFVTVSAEFTLAGRLGYVNLNNCNGVGHSSGVRLLGRLALDSTSSDLAIGLQGYGGNYPEVLFDDIGGTVANGPVWMLGGRGEVVGPMRIGGAGSSAGRFCMRDQSFIELGRAVVDGYFDIALGSELRIAGSAGTGNLDAAIVDGTDALLDPLFDGEFAAGDSYIGQFGSVARRD